jgi:hypothetical protein
MRTDSRGFPKVIRQESVQTGRDSPLKERFQYKAV